MSRIVIYDLRLTFLWAEALRELLQAESAPPESLLPFLWNESSYQKRFADILVGQKDPLGFEPPWRHPAGNHFWTFYLESKVPGQTSGKEAWRFLVPFRVKVPVEIQIPEANESSTSVEAFYYPSGVGVALNVRLTGTWSLEEAVEQARKVSSDPLNVTWQGGIGEPLSLDGFSRKLLQRLGSRVVGPAWPGTGEGARSFSIVTVVRGEGVDPAPSVPPGSEIHRALQGLTSWSPAWKESRLAPLDEAILPIQWSSPPSHALYSGTRGRAVWAPAYFKPEMNGRRLLGCYHRNLSMLSLQVESLACLAEVTADILDHGRTLGQKHDGCARRAVGILGRLYGGNQKTYRSHSPKAQIDQGGFREAINTVRKLSKQGPLQAEIPQGV